MFSKNTVQLVMVIGTAGVLFSAGCATPKRTYQPAQDHNSLNELEFVHYLSDLPAVSMDEAYHAMLLLLREEATGMSFEQREAILTQRGIARKAWGLSANDLLDKGTLAYMVVQVCRLPQWVNDLALGSWGLGDRRYALRRAVWYDMVPYGMPYHAVTGGELLATITKAADYMEQKGLDREPAPAATGG